MAERVRVLSLQVIVQAVTDDGENLTPLPVQPVNVAWADRGSLFTPELDGLIDALQQQVDAPPA